MTVYTIERHKAVFFTKGRERPVRRIVLHWMATTLAGCDATFAGGVRQASAHFGLEDNKRHQYVDKTDTAWHAGVREINHESIGIEHSAQPGRDASEATIANSIDLCTALCREFGLTADDIDQHNDFKATQCPGTLPVKRIREAVRANLAGSSAVVKEWDEMATKDEIKDALREILKEDGLVASPMFATNPTVAPVTALRWAMEWSLQARNAAQAAANDGDVTADELAAAIPDALAQQVVDALATRLTPKE